MNPMWGFFQGVMNLFWLGIVIAFVVLESMTVNLVSIWFALGGAAALIASLLHMRFLTQLSIFVMVSAISLIATRPLVRRWSVRRVPTNADRVIHGTGRVTEPVDAEQGAVHIDGKIWSARSENGCSIPVDARVRVERIEGVKLIVSPLPEPSGTVPPDTKKSRVENIF